MTGWIVLGAVVLLLAAALLLPLAVRLTYDRGALVVGVRLGPVERTLWPRPNKQEKQEKQPSKPKQSKKTAKSGKSAAGGEKKRPTRQQLLYALDTLPPILGRALKRTGRRVRVEPLKLHLLVAGPDPADTALLYGRLEAALAAGLPVLHRLVRIREQDIRLFLDFQEERMDCIADVGVSLRVGDALAVVLCAALSLLKWLIGFRKLAAQPPTNQTNTPPTPAEKE